MKILNQKNTVWQRAIVNGSEVMVKLSETSMPDGYVKIDANYLSQMIGISDISTLTLVQIISTYNLIPENAIETDEITAFRIRKLISPNTTDINIQLQEQAKMQRMVSWAQDIRIQFLEGKSPLASDVLTATAIMVQALPLNTDINNIRAEGSAYKTSNGLV